VAKGLLMPYRLNIEALESGRAAVKRIRDGNTYDVIFMDHMMPDMDGIRATKIIRGMGYTGAIVALTANTVVGQAELFMQNGFSDFISKPIDPNLLDSILIRHIRNKNLEKAAQINARVTEVRTIFDDSSRDLPDQLIKSFLRDVHKSVDVLHKLIGKPVLNHDDYQQLLIHAHAMKSALANVNEYDLSDVAYILENAARVQDEDTIKAMLPEFLDQLATVIQIMTNDFKTEFDGFDSDVSEDVDFINEHLVLIYNACKTYNKKAAKKAMAAISSQPCSKKTRELMDLISELLLHGSFEEAAVLAQKSLDAIF